MPIHVERISRPLGRRSTMIDRPLRRLTVPVDRTNESLTEPIRHVSMWYSFVGRFSLSVASPMKTSFSYRCDVIQGRPVRALRNPCYIKLRRRYRSSFHRDISSSSVYSIVFNQPPLLQVSSQGHKVTDTSCSGHNPSAIYGSCRCR